MLKHIGILLLAGCVTPDAAKTTDAPSPDMIVATGEECADQVAVGNLSTVSTIVIAQPGPDHLAQMDKNAKGGFMFAVLVAAKSADVEALTIGHQMSVSVDDYKYTSADAHEGPQTEVIVDDVESFKKAWKGKFPATPNFPAHVLRFKIIGEATEPDFDELRIGFSVGWDEQTERFMFKFPGDCLQRTE